MKAKQTILLLLALIIISTLWGCSSDKLSRQKAEELIRVQYKFPHDEIGALTIAGSWMESTFKQLESQGLLTYTVYQDAFGTYYTGELTQKGKQYAVSEKYKESGDNYNMHINVKIATLDFGQITGIVETNPNITAVVNYTCLRKDLTPFGSIKHPQSQFDLTEGYFIESRTFTKYDDGWRMNPIAQPITKHL